MSVLSTLIVATLLGGMLTAYAAGTGTVEPPPRTAFLARADNPADALAAGPIAGRMGAPMFTTPAHVLDDHARQGLVEYAPQLVILTGGGAALSAEVESAVKAALPQATVLRVAGAGRTETARKIAALINEYSPGFLPVDATAVEAVHAGSADLLGGHKASDFVKVGDTLDADTLQGKNAAAFLPAAGKAVDSARIDGQSVFGLKHTSAPGTLKGSCTFIDDARLNGNPNVIVSAIHQLTGASHSSPLGLYYEAINLDFQGQWCIYNKDGSTLTSGHTFHVIVVDPN